MKTLFLVPAPALPSICPFFFWPHPHSITGCASRRAWAQGMEALIQLLGPNGRAGQEPGSQRPAAAVGTGLAGNRATSGDVLERFPEKTPLGNASLGHPLEWGWGRHSLVGTSDSMAEDNPLFGGTRVVWVAVSLIAESFAGLGFPALAPPWRG